MTTKKDYESALANLARGLFHKHPIDVEDVKYKLSGVSHADVEQIAQCLNRAFKKSLKVHDQV